MMPLSLNDVDLFSPEFKQQSYQLYKKLRQDQPVFPFKLPTGKQAWLVTKHEDALNMFKSSKIVKDFKNVNEGEGDYFLENGAYLGENMLSSDPPDHTRLRKLVSKAFTPKMIAQLEDDIQAVTDRLLAPVKEKGHMDAISDFALPLPIIVISNMLGIPEKDRDAFHDWSAVIVESANDQSRIVENQNTINAFITYIRDLVDEKRQHPDDRLISLMIDAHDEGDRLSEQELIATIFLLIVAGHETTVNLIANGLYALFQHPEQMIRLRQNPDLMENAIEEMLRYHGPVEIAPIRYAAEAMDWHGQQMERGDAIFISLAAVNRDPDVYDNPDQFDIARENIKHFAFGKGIHFCLGAPLARLEAKVAFRTLLSEFSDLSLSVPDDEMKWRPGMMMRGLEALPVDLRQQS